MGCILIQNKCETSMKTFEMLKLAHSPSFFNISHLGTLLKGLPDIPKSKTT
jgi:hypothetical protein